MIDRVNDILKEAWKEAPGASIFFLMSLGGFLGIMAHQVLFHDGLVTLVGFVLWMGLMVAGVQIAVNVDHAVSRRR